MSAELFAEGALEIIHAEFLAECLDGRHGLAFASHREGEAGELGSTIDQHGAGAALAAVTTALGAVEPGLFAQVIESQQRVGHRIFAGAAVKNEGQKAFHGISLPAERGSRYRLRPREGGGNHAVLRAGRA
jgi:hypothetical protein